MSTVSATIDLDCPPEDVWKLIMDPTRFNEWVTIHRKICDADDGPVREGFKVEQRMALRGAPFTVHWTLTECDAPNLGTWEGKGPAGSYARVDQQALSRTATAARTSSTRTRSRRRAARWGGWPRACWWAACPSARPTSRSRSSRSCSS